jgi:hypothetical protein
MRTLALFFLIGVPLLHAADLAVLGSFQVTHDSNGIASGIEKELQGSKPSIGGAVEFRHSLGKWWIEGIYSVAASDARFRPVGMPGELKFGLTRNEIGGQVMRQFRSEMRLQPFIAVGMGEFITDGKWAPGGVVGLDYQLEETATGGTDLELGRHFALRSEAVMHCFRAPNFSDVNFKADRTFMVEARIGLVWKF